MTVTATKTITNNGIFGLNDVGHARTLTLQGTAASANYSGNDIAWGGNNLTVGNLVYAPAATLPSGTTVTLNNGLSFSAGVTAQAGSTIAVGVRTLTLGADSSFDGTVNVSGPTGQIAAGANAIVNTGTINVQAANGAAIACGAFTSSGTVNNGFTNTITASGNVAVSGTFGTPGNSTITMTGAGTTINTAVQIGSLTTSGAATVTVLTNALNLSGSLNLATGTSVSLAGLGATISGAATGAGTGTLNGGTAAVTIGATSRCRCIPRRTVRQASRERR